MFMIYGTQRPHDTSIHDPQIKQAPTNDDDDARAQQAAAEAQAAQRARLSRVLWAFALHDPRIKYCQGMNWVCFICVYIYVV